MNNADWVNKDFYKTLGVAKDADQAAIKKAYRKLARDHHPDSHPGDKAAEERFKEVAEAYDVVGDPAKRKEYDDLRAAYAGGGFPGGFGGGFGGAGDGGAGFDISDLLGDIFGGGRGGGFGRGQQRGPRPAKGADLETETTLSFEDAMAGSTISLRLSSDAACATCSGTGGKPGTRPHVCTTCNGTGQVISSMGGAFQMTETCPQCHGRQLVYDETCPTCHGSGRGTARRTITARIPAGVKDGARIRLKGKGGAGEHGGPAGDLFVVVRVTPHRLFHRKGDNLHLTVPVRFDEAVLGAEIKVPTLGGPSVTLRLPEGTPNGRVFRVRGKGAPKKDGSHGDLLVTVEVQVDTAPDEAIKEAVSRYRAAVGSVDPRAALLGGV